MTGREKLMVASSGVMVPVLILAGLVASATKGGAGLRLGQEVLEVHKVDEAHFSWLGDGPVFVLVMGNDARPGDRVSRGDALHVVGVNRGTGQATILNIPRDTWTQVPGRGTDKINAAHIAGGPRLQAQAVGQLVGVEIPYVVSTGFDGFMAMVDELGGVDVDVPFRMADANSGANFEPGRNHLLGGPALAFARNRNLQGGDFTRTHHQAVLILAALAKLRGQGTSLTNTIKWLAVLLRHATFDGAGMADIYQLGQLALSIDPANVRNVTMPGVVGSAANQSVVFPTPAAASLFADFRDDGVLQSH